MSYQRSPCLWCGGSRAGQIQASYYTPEGDPLCLPCWAAEYGSDKATVTLHKTSALGRTEEQAAMLNQIALPQAWTAPDGERVYIALHGVEYGLSPLEAEALFLALGRQLEPGDMARWFPSAAPGVTPNAD